GRGWAGKLTQTLWALRLESHLSKQQILEQYLNRVPLGQGAVGAPAAVGLYFNTSASHLSLGQAALLAGLAHSPSGFNPLVSPSRALSRRTAALHRLQTLEYASPAEVASASAEPVLERNRPAPFLAPHFTTQLLQWAEVEGRRLNGIWRTSLDLELQTALEAEVRHTVDLLRDRGAKQAAAVVLDNTTGEILAWVGSPDFWADTAGQVDMVISPRQPGSALKPFLYGLAFDRGYTAASVLADVAHTYQTGSGPYHPRNYDRQFHGPVRAREALGSSYNLPAVELANRIGFATLLNGLQLAGFASLQRSAEHYGLGLALGNGDVTLLELANGYRALANGGVWRPYRWVAEPQGAAIGPERRVMSPLSAALVLDILSDPVARIPGFGLRTPFDFPFPVAAKSGTSRHFTDNWSVGTTQRFTVAVWVGNFSGRPMEGVTGVSGAGPLLHRAVLLVARRYPPGHLASPEQEGAVPVTICRLSGLRATAECPGTVEWFAPGTEPARQCDWHVGGRVRLPVEYAEWVEQRGGVAPDSLAAGRGVRERGQRTFQASSTFRIMSPRDGDRYQVPPGVEGRYSTLALRATGLGEGEIARWFIDGRMLRGSRWPLQAGLHRIRGMAPSGAGDEVSILVE
ncbi:MAG: transglycosylase domain-containing protein, partial [Gemmatimonadales bacterium]